MKTAVKFLIIFSLVVIGSCRLLAQDQIVTLPNGRKVVLHSNKTWNYYEGIKYNFDFNKLRDNEIPSFLRQGIAVNRATLRTAVEMYLQGWRYRMPVPKSAQARWGNTDGRTTWWYGYWYNEKNGKYSSITPTKQENGYYTGNGQNEKGYWRRGGSPSYPTKLEWLLSNYGGVRP